MVKHLFAGTKNMKKPLDFLSLLLVIVRSAFNIFYYIGALFSIEKNFAPLRKPVG
jgi:hypothetical protein